MLLPTVWPTLAVPMAIDAPSHRVSQNAPQSKWQQIDGELVIEYKHAQGTMNPKVLRFIDGVKISYGPTTIVADEVTLYLDDDQRHGEAIGHVRLDDPEGTATAARLVFNWKDKTGSAFDVKAQVEGLKFSAREADIYPGRWELFDLFATNWMKRPPLYYITSPHAVVQPGRLITVEKPRLTAFGIRLGAFSKFEQGLGPSSGGGFGFPSPSYKRDQGFGLTWRGASFVRGEQNRFSGGFGAYAHRSPSYGFQLSHSLVPPGDVNQLITPSTELDDRFNTSYFETINVGAPDNDERTIRAHRSAVTLGTFRKVVTTDRIDNAGYTKPVEVVFDKGGSHEDLGYYGQIRFQSVRRNDEDLHNRIVVQSTLDMLSHKISYGLRSHLRADGAGYFGAGTTFGWARIDGALSYEPTRLFTFGASAFLGSEVGNSLYQDDRLYARTGVTGRADLNFGATKLSMLAKYDTDHHHVFDQELGMTQAMDGLEAFVVYRKFPSQYLLGVRLRVDSLMSALSKRRSERSKPLTSKRP